MAYTIKGGKVRKRQVGDIIRTRHLLDSNGGHWWIEDTNPDDIPHGPFSTQEESQRNAEAVLFGPDFKIEEGGQWDSAWDRPQ
jgi:hypothetical protein